MVHLADEFWLHFIDGGLFCKAQALFLRPPRPRYRLAFEAPSLFNGSTLPGK